MNSVLPLAARPYKARPYKKYHLSSWSKNGSDIENEGSNPAENGDAETCQTLLYRGLKSA